LFVSDTHFRSQYHLHPFPPITDTIQMLNMKFYCKHTIAICRLPCLFGMAEAVSSTVEVVNSVTSYCIGLCNFGMGAFATKCFTRKLVS
jgi:hypothetical protein